MDLDVRGEVCPYPMMKAVEAMKKSKNGEAIKVITDHAPCLETIPPQAKKLKFDVEVREVGSPEWHIILTPQKGGA